MADVYQNEGDMGEDMSVNNQKPFKSIDKVNDDSNSSNSSINFQEYINHMNGIASKRNKKVDKKKEGNKKEDKVSRIFDYAYNRNLLH